MTRKKNKKHRFVTIGSYVGNAPSQIAAARKEYQTAKRLYHKIGKQAFGKPSRSGVQRDYSTIKREYRRTGKQLANLTGRKPRRK